MYIDCNLLQLNIVENACQQACDNGRDPLSYVITQQLVAAVAPHLLSSSCLQ